MLQIDPTNTTFFLFSRKTFVSIVPTFLIPAFNNFCTQISISPIFQEMRCKKHFLCFLKCTYKFIYVFFSNNFSTPYFLNLNTSHPTNAHYHEGKPLILSIYIFLRYLKQNSSQIGQLFPQIIARQDNFVPPINHNELLLSIFCR